MKKLVGVDIGNYSFDKTNKTITFTGFDFLLTLHNILLVTNVTTNTMIYNFASLNTGGDVSNNVLTLDFNTSGMSNTDSLQIYIDVTDNYEDSNFEMMERIIMMANTNSIVNIDNMQMLIADSVPGYPITSNDLGTAITQSILFQSPSIAIDSYPVYYPAPVLDDPDNINNNYIINNYLPVFPANDVYAQTVLRHLLVSKSPVEQRWEISIDSQTEYATAIRDKLSWSS